jgi:hypothetical protein
MIDTLMAFWNQNRRKRATQVLLTFFLMCISTSLLFVIVGVPQWSHPTQRTLTTRKLASNVGDTPVTTPTVVVHSTLGPQTSPTTTVVVPSQATAQPTAQPTVPPVIASNSISCVTPVGPEPRCFTTWAPSGPPTHTWRWRTRCSRVSKSDG